MTLIAESYQKGFSKISQDKADLVNERQNLIKNLAKYRVLANSYIKAEVVIVTNININ